jgi:multidrug efflux pump subunit AcrA (membrane-fusion protein)
MMTTAKLFAMCLSLLVATACEKAESDQHARKGRGEGKNESKSEGKSEGKGGRGRRDKSTAVAVRAQRADAKSLPETLEVVSVLAGRRQAEVYARVAGKVSFIGPAEGQRVKEGETIARVDRSDPSESFLATPVVSPISGWIGRWLVTSIGTQVAAQDALVTVVDDEKLRASVMLPTDQWLRVSSETIVNVRVGEQSRPAKVTAIARAAESTASRGTVTLEIDNPDHSWKSGMVALVDFALDVKPRLVVPASALSITDQGPFVYAVKDGKAQRVPVKFTVIDNDSVELTSGIEAGAQLVTEGVNQIGDGSAVKVVDDVVPTGAPNAEPGQEQGHGKGGHRRHEDDAPAANTTDNGGAGKSSGNGDSLSAKSPPLSAVEAEAATAPAAATPADSAKAPRQGTGGAFP